MNRGRPATPKRSGLHTNRLGLHLNSHLHSVYAPTPAEMLPCQLASCRHRLANDRLCNIIEHWSRRGVQGAQKMEA